MGTPCCLMWMRKCGWHQYCTLDEYWMMGQGSLVDGWGFCLLDGFVTTSFKLGYVLEVNQHYVSCIRKWRTMFKNIIFPKINICEYVCSSICGNVGIYLLNVNGSKFHVFCWWLQLCIQNFYLNLHKNASKLLFIINRGC